MKYLWAIILVVGCTSNRCSELHTALQKDFHSAIEQSKAQRFEYHYDGLVPQESYFLNGKIRFLKYKMSGDSGYTEGLIYFNPRTDSMEKYIVLDVDADWSDDKNKYYPIHAEHVYIKEFSESKTSKYTDGLLTDVVDNDHHFTDNATFIYAMKAATEDVYRSRAGGGQ